MKHKSKKKKIIFHSRFYVILIIMLLIVAICLLDVISKVISKPKTETAVEPFYVEKKIRVIREFAYEEDLVDTSNEVLQITEDYVYTTDYLNYRLLPDENAEILGTLDIGEEIYRFGTAENGWSKVLIDNIECFVSTDFLSSEKPEITPQITYSSYSPNDLRSQGVIYWGDWRFTWYSERVLPGGGLNIPGRYSDGNFVRDENGYLCVASSDLTQGTVLETPWGTAKVYDSGCDSGTIDMYVSW